MSAEVSADAPLSIGEVLALVRPDFPDVSISKIRFLEAEGLLAPERTPAGYRKFRARDVERLRYVLTAQRDAYLPLRVIKERLAALDQGDASAAPGTPPAGTPRAETPAASQHRPDPEREADTERDLAAPATPRATAPATAASTAPSSDDLAADADSFRREASGLRLSRGELLEAAAIDAALLRQLESYGLIAPNPDATGYDEDALQVAKTVAAMRSYGLEPRHLRAFKTAADREVGLIEQVVAPLLRQRGPGSSTSARERAQGTSRELAALSVRLHASLLHAALRAATPR